MKKLILLAALILLLTSCIFSAKKEEPKTSKQIAQEQKDSLQKIRAKKIDFALTYLKMTIQKNMKNPNSYDMITRDYDHKDTLNTVKMYIKFRGDNSFGGKTISRVDAVYNFKTDHVNIVHQSVE